ncbi:MAG: guanylate kinase [Alphaproteobacteria bacterium]|nr:guanylate kinase [Alphaproteobacteria bacterium]
MGSIVKIAPPITAAVVKRANTKTVRKTINLEGQDYFFVDEETFKTRLDKEEFLEHAKVFGNYYGTPKDYVFAALKNGKDIIFDIDWQGTQQMALYARNDLVSVFILPPSAKDLSLRLQTRGQDTPDVINYRMSQAANEMSHWAEYDYVIINKDLEESIRQIQEILHSERRKRTRQLGLVDFVNDLREEM